MTEVTPNLLDDKALLAFLEERGEKPYRLKQIWQSLYGDLATDMDDFTTLSKDLREAVKDHFVLSPLKVVDDAVSKDGTNKVLFETHDGHHIEAVLMRHKTSRLTLCISSQVGCPVKCIFCATGTMGYTRNLTTEEIAAQVLFFNQKLKEEDARVRNIVFMGMGEPLLNFDHVLEVIGVLQDQKKFSIGKRHITISTSGIVPKIRALIETDNLVNLAVSLHAPNDELRTKLMPINTAYPLKDLMVVLEEFEEATGKRIFYEYVMLAGLNDQEDHALELAKLVKHQHAHINLIPYNPGGNFDTLSCSKRDTILKFQKILQLHGVPCTIRYTFGQDIDAACGQLAAKKQSQTS